MRAAVLGWETSGDMSMVCTGLVCVHGPVLEAARSGHALSGCVLQCFCLASSVCLRRVLRLIACMRGCFGRSRSCCVRRQQTRCCRNPACRAARVLRSTTLWLQWHRAVACTRAYVLCVCVGVVYYLFELCVPTVTQAAAVSSVFVCCGWVLERRADGVKEASGPSYLTNHVATGTNTKHRVQQTQLLQRDPTGQGRAGSHMQQSARA